MPGESTEGTVPPRLALALATAFGAGRCRPGPGTWGSAAAAIVALAILGLCGPDAGRLVLIALLAATLGASIWAVPRAVAWYGREDPGQIVIDEVAGVLLGVAILPATSLAAPLTPVLAVGILFRVFDIAKPGVVGSLESLGGTVGLMADDLAAGLLAGALTTALLC